VSFLLPLGLLTGSPPGALLAHLFRLQHETFGLDNVEEQFAYKVGSCRVGLLQTRTESVNEKKKSLAGYRPDR
jgi:hypothetical protein